ncbi:hypothetical protein vBRpoSV10_51 [Ruegeria phage vB_RpoS-V10]|nr:hypothetical protein vBRpoSV10_51 [Ruegeria phage vB_RpoS-V10]
MASSIGRIALGVVGALIGAPFGLSAIGFSIGSAIGGALFAPDGPKTEGPRLGDTNVSASSLGKVITEHYGVTRSSGNMIWSAGLKEVKVTEKQGGGKGGGGGATSTTYEYYASFATVFGRGPGTEVRKIWADGKIIYDATGESETNNEKYRFRFYSGGPNQVIDPLIQESVNRRLAGLPDVNEGNQEQADYQSLSDVISSAYASGDARSALYGDLLTVRKASAEAVEGIPDYRFTPAYRGLCFILFDDMPLEDFGNRIPNLTAEIVWDGATANNGSTTPGEIPTITGTAVTEISNLAVPSGLMAIDYNNEKLFGLSGDVMRRFGSDSNAEDRQATVGTPTPTVLVGTPTSVEEYGIAIDRLLAVGSEGTVYAAATLSYTNFFGGTISTNSLLALSGTGLTIIGPVIDPILPSATLRFGTHLRMSGSLPASLIFGGTGGTTGEHMAFVDTADTIHAMRLNSGDLQATSSITSAVDGTHTNNGPLVAGASISSGVTQFFHCAYAGNRVKIVRYEVTNNAIKQGWLPTDSDEINVVEKKSSSLTLTLTSNINRVSALVWNSTTDDLIMIATLNSGSTAVLRVDEDLAVDYLEEIAAAGPLETSGLSRSDTSNGTLAYASARDIIAISVADGTHIRYVNALAANASSAAQFYNGTNGSLLLWEGDAPYIYRVGRSSGASRGHDIADLLPRVIQDVCERAGMLPDEFDVSGLSDLAVRGYSISRPSTGRQVMENLLQAYFADGIETDWKVVFADRDTNSVRTIDEAELGEIGGPTGPVNWLESRTPEYEIPAEININYSDPMRDYQTGTAHKKRISNPIPSMYSDSTQNLELPMVLRDSEAMDIAERLLYLSWMSRDRSKAMLNWTHADLDPGDVISVRFKDGRVITDRISKATIGANFEIEIESARSGDPVYASAPQTIIPTGSIPSNNISTPVNSRVFVLDIPLLYDYHDTSRSASRFYTAVGADSDKWRSATIYGSWDNGTFLSFANAAVDATWGTTTTKVQPPRSLWTTDRDNEIRVALSIDNGDLVSITREQLINGANRALIWNPSTGVGEIIQFQNAAIDGSTYVLTGLVRGLRGTEYAVDKHSNGAYFILLQDSVLTLSDNELSRIGTTGYFKAVSAGQLISAVGSSTTTFRGNDLKPWAPSRVRRTDDGTDITVTWNRRTRVGGAWNMLTTYETVALSEDFEQYEVYLLPAGGAAQDAFDPSNPATYHTMTSVTGATSCVFSGAVLSAHGYTVDDTINVALYQISGQVGRGFARIGGLAP